MSVRERKRHEREARKAQETEEYTGELKEAAGKAAAAALAARVAAEATENLLKSGRPMLKKVDIQAEAAAAAAENAVALAAAVVVEAKKAVQAKSDRVRALRVVSEAQIKKREKDEAAASAVTEAEAGY